MKKVWVVLLVFGQLLICTPPVQGEMPSDEPLNSDREKVKPLFDFPLRDTHIMYAPDGHYYMTGTLSKDDEGRHFETNAGVRLWKSSALENWEDLGLVWSIERDAPGSPESAWQLRGRLPALRPGASFDQHEPPPGSEPARGITAPEILHIRDNYYITYSMNGHGCGLLKSTTGRPEGPYEDLGRMTASGGDPSLFEDEDGTVYFIWGQGFIAAMNEDLTAIIGQPRTLLANLDLDLDAKQRFFGSQGCDPVRPHGFRVQRCGIGGRERYMITFAAENCRFGRSMKETFTSMGEDLFGNYEFPRLSVTNGGQSTLFRDVEGKWFGTFHGADAVAEFRDRPAIVPLEHGHGGNLTNRRTNFFTERGPWDTVPFCRPELRMNDAMICNAPDGYYYLAGSNWTKEFWDQVYLYRSKEMHRGWERIGPVFHFEDIPWVAEIKKRYPEFLTMEEGKPWTKKGGGVPWGMEIHHIGGRFYVIFGVSTRVGRAISDYAHHVTGGKHCVVIASDSGTGPYHYHASIGVAMPTFFVDDDGVIYMTMGGATKMKPDMTGFAEARQRPEQKEGLVLDYDPIGSCMVKIGGRYVFWSSNLYSGYDYQYWVADSPNGPYSRPRVGMPHGGHGGVFQDKEGGWNAVMWHAFQTFSPTVMPLHVHLSGDDVVIVPEYEWEHTQRLQDR